MDKIAEIFQGRSQNAFYLPSVQEELLKHLMTRGCVNSGGLQACLWSLDLLSLSENMIWMLSYSVHILEEIYWVVSLNVCAILWDGFSQARQYFQHEVVHNFMIKCKFNNGTGGQVVCSDPLSLF